MQVAMQGLWARAKQLWRLGEGAWPLSGAVQTWHNVWCAWQYSLHIWPICPGPLACVMGPEHSGRHAMAHALIQRALLAHQSCVWLGPGLKIGLRHQTQGSLLWAKPAEPAAAAAMLETLLKSWAAETIVWVVTAPADEHWLAQQWPRWTSQAWAAGCCVLVVAPAQPTTQMLTGPVWHMADRPWVGSLWAPDRK